MDEQYSKVAALLTPEDAASAASAGEGEPAEADCTEANTLQPDFKPHETKKENQS